VNKESAILFRKREKRRRKENRVKAQSTCGVPEKRTQRKSGIGNKKGKKIIRQPLGLSGYNDRKKKSRRLGTQREGREMGGALKKGEKMTGQSRHQKKKFVSIVVYSRGGETPSMRR